MRIGIITYHRAENYGSVLQAYALNKYIRDLNKQYEVETIDYYNQAQMEMYTLFQPNTCIMNIVRNIHTLLNKHALLQKKASFQKFIEQYIPLSIITKRNLLDTLIIIQYAFAGAIKFGIPIAKIRIQIIFYPLQLDPIK